MTAVYPVTLTGRHVRLREVRHSDVDAVADIVGDDQVTTWLSFDSRDREQAASMVAGIVDRAQADPRTEYYLVVTPAPGDDQVIGFVRIGLSGVQAGKLGYAIRADRWGHGYATDAAAAMLAFAFGTLRLHRVSAAIGPDNAASLQVVQRLGFVREGVLRDHVFTNGAWRDSVLYSLLATEWAERQSRATPEPAVPQGIH